MADKKIKSRKLNKSQGNGEVKRGKKEEKTVSLDQVLNRVESSKKRAVQRRKEHDQSLQIKKIKTRKIKIKDFEQREKEIDREIDQQDNLSISLMVVILIICFIVGILLGYMLYRIAINSSNALLIVRSLFR